jgi:hypothetical protein
VLLLVGTVSAYAYRYVHTQPAAVTRVIHVVPATTAATPTESVDVEPATAATIVALNVASNTNNDAVTESVSSSDTRTQRQSHHGDSQRPQR